MSGMKLRFLRQITHAYVLAEKYFGTLSFSSLYAGQNAQQGRFSRTVFSDQSYFMAFVYTQANIPEQDLGP